MDIEHRLALEVRRCPAPLRVCTACQAAMDAEDAIRTLRARVEKLELAVSDIADSLSGATGLTEGDRIKIREAMDTAARASAGERGE